MTTNIVDLSSLSVRASAAHSEQQQLLADLIGSMVAADDGRARQQLGDTLAALLGIPAEQCLRARLTPPGDADA